MTKNNETPIKTQNPPCDKIKISRDIIASIYTKARAINRDDFKFFTEIISLLCLVGTLLYTAKSNYISEESNLISVKSNIISNESNFLSKKAILASHIPFVSIDNPTFNLSEQKITIPYTITNHSDTPAIKLQVNILCEGIPNPKNNLLYKKTIVMPHVTEHMSFYLQNSASKEIFNKIINGTISIDFIINYEDIFNNKYQIIETGKFINNEFNHTNFESKGFDQLIN